MKSKNKIELNNSIAEVFDRATTLVNSLIELHNLKSKPIPEYQKGAKDYGLMIVGQGNTKETIITLDGDIIRLQNKDVIISAPIGSEIYTTFDYEALFKEYKRIGAKLMSIDKSVEHSTAGAGNYPSKGMSDYWISFFNSNKVVSEGGFRSGRTHFYEEWSKQLNEHLRGKRVDISEPFAMAPITIKEKFVLCDGKNTPFHPEMFFQKGMLEADKELQKVCKGNCEHNYIETITWKCINCGYNVSQKEVLELLNEMKI